MQETTAQYLERRYRRYAIYVNMNRAMPAFSDGLKLGQRIAMWLMRTHSSGKIKTLALSGEMAASLLYVHGDQSAQDSISRLAAPYVNNVPLLKGEGNFGTLLVPNGWAAARYTDIKQQPYLKELLYSDLDILPMIDNYDGSKKMPAHFLPLIPLALLNGASGSGVGFACSFFPRSFKNLVQATLLAIEGKPIPDELLQPVFGYNGDNTGKFVEYSKDQKPRWEFRGEFTPINVSSVTVTRLPSIPKYLLENYKDFLNEQIEKGVIVDYEDHSTKHIKIIVKFSRGALKTKTDEEIMNDLGLIKVATENIVLVGNDMDSLPQYRHKPDHKYPNPVERLIRDWVDWRIGFLEERYRLLVEQTEIQLNYLEVLLACYKEDLPKYFQGAKNKGSLKDRVREIAATYGKMCDDSVEERIVDRASYSWTVDSKARVEQEFQEQTDLLATYTDLLNNPNKRRTVFRGEVNSLNKIKV